jgi:RNA polymerase sigma-70 factor (ECF subfamily)
VSADDNRLIADCLAGRTEAFGELVSRYQDRVFNTVLRLVGNAEDARDVVQEAFIHAYQSLPAFKGDSLFYTWLYRIAVNAGITYRRKHKTALQIYPGGAAGDAADPMDASVFSRPGYALEMAEEEKRIHDALNRLSPEHRAVLILKDMEGQKYEDMAQVLEVPIGTIRSRLHRARLELRDILLQEKKITK